MNLEYFSNDKYEILKILFQNQIEIKEEKYVSLSQQEIADLGHYSKLKVNKILNELLELCCLSHYKNKRGKYVITEKGKKIVEYVQNANI